MNKMERKNKKSRERKLKRFLKFKAKEKTGKELKGVSGGKKDRKKKNQR